MAAVSFRVDSTDLTRSEVHPGLPGAAPEPAEAVALVNRSPARHHERVGYFYDAATGGPARLELRSIDGRDFTVLRSLGYRSDRYDEPFVFPVDLEHFTTDLASVPALFTWLVPVSGPFAPAAVLHDALTDDRPQPLRDPVTGVVTERVGQSYRGPVVDRPEADRIFRVAMRELGTGHVRCWLMWSAVTMVTMWSRQAGTVATRVALAGTLAVILIMGALSTLDLLDVITLLPWMGERPFAVELITGGLAALIVPTVLAISWGRFFLAGMITGWALALLLHVTVAVAALFGLYLLVERLVSGPVDRRGVRIRARRR